MSSEDDASRIDAFNHALSFRCLSMVEAQRECVYHYTTAEGFAGILKDRAIRTTNFSYLNDPTEIRFGEEVAKRELESLSLDSSPTGKTFIAGVSRNLAIETSQVYVASFTALDDDLSQWRAYGGSLAERYAIGFDAPTLHGLALQKPNATYSQVLYKKDEQRERVAFILRRAIELVESEFTEEQYLETYSSAAARHLVRLLPLLKHSAYDGEAESRLVVWHRAGDVQPSVDTSRGVLRPYLLFELGEEPIPVTDLNIMAPTRREAALKAAAILLQAHRISDVTPFHSLIPFAD